MVLFRPGCHIIYRINLVRQWGLRGLHMMLGLYDSKRNSWVAKPVTKEETNSVSREEQQTESAVLSEAPTQHGLGS